MTPKQYLQQMYRLDELIRSNQREIDSLRQRSVSLGGSDFEEHFSSGEKVDKLGNIVAKIIDLEHEVELDILKYVKLQTEIRSVINQQENETERLLLRLRYIEFLKWEEIACRMNYCIKQIYRIHGNALRNLKMSHNVTKEGAIMLS